MRRKQIESITAGCLPKAADFLHGLLACLVITLCGCKSQKEVQVERVEVPVPIVQEHTVESVKIDHVRDTLIQRDSIFHYVKGDTVLIEKWHYLQGSTNVVRVDTLIKTDSVEVPVEVVREVVKTEQVERPLTWWQRTRMVLGGILLAVLGLGAVYGMLRLYGKKYRL